MITINKISSKIHSKVGAYIFFIFSLFSILAFKSADWSYGWIAEGYPLGEKFIPAFLILTGICTAVNLICLFIYAYRGNDKENLKTLNIIHLIFAILSVITFIYTIILLFGIDSGITLQKINTALNAISNKLVYLALGCGFALVLVFTKGKKQSVKAIICSVIICSIISSMVYFASPKFSTSTTDDFIKPAFSSENILDGAKITFESLASNEKEDAENLLDDSNKCWSAQSPNRGPKKGYDDVNNAVVEIKLKKVETFNTAVIEELGNQAQYFRLQAKVGDEWKTVYQSEKIQSLKLCSFDNVTTDTVRLSIDKFRDNTVPVKIKSLKLYNEKKHDAKNFEVTAYQRLDGDVPTQILKKGDEYVKTYAKFYDVYSTIIVFAAVQWDENGDITFGENGEENFAKELDALKEIIGKRSNKEHKVKLIVTTLADGAFGGNVNEYMAKYWEKIESQTIDFAKKYDIDGVDIDWEYPLNSDDWKVFDSFIQKLYKDLKAYKDDTIISTALSASRLGMSKETFDCIDQIQFMAYDGCDTDGYQSSLEQAEQGLKEFKDNGADISKINIGIAAYGRPINSTPFWASWRYLHDANYWNSKYYTVEDANQVYEGTFCSPALAGDKTAYALLTGAGGVMVFRVAYDKTMDDPNSVANGIKNTMNRLVDKW